MSSTNPSTTPTPARPRFDPVEVRLEGIDMRFAEVHALRNVDLTMAQGKFTTLLGPSGCGKTTLLRIVAGFLQPTSGRLWFDDEDVTDRPPWRRNTGFVFQNYALWPHMTVFDNVAYGLRLRRLPRATIREKVESWLERVGLAGMGNRQPGQLSGGQQQRVSLIRALALEPRVLLLDEPLSNLDAKLRVEMRHEIRRIQRETELTAVYVTHDQEEALELSDVVAVMQAGSIDHLGTPEEVYENPATPFVAEFIGAVSLLPGEVRPEHVALDDGTTLALAVPERPAGARVQIAVRPENIRLCEAEEAHMTGRVRTTSYLGSLRRTVVDVTPSTRLLVNHRRPLHEGDEVHLHIERFAALDPAA